VTCQTHFYQIPKLSFQNPIWFQGLFKVCTKMETIEDFQRPVATVQILLNVIIKLFGTLIFRPLKVLLDDG